MSAVCHFFYFLDDDFCPFVELLIRSYTIVVVGCIGFLHPRGSRLLTKNVIPQRGTGSRGRGRHLDSSREQNRGAAAV